jgi:hypothetical protein
VPFPEGRTSPIPCWNVVRSSGSSYSAAFPFACGQVVNSQTGALIAGGFATP